MEDSKKCGVKLKLAWGGGWLKWGNRPIDKKNQSEYTRCLHNISEEKNWFWEEEVAQGAPKWLKLTF